MNNQWVNRPLSTPHLMGKTHGTSYHPNADINLEIIQSNNLTMYGYPDNDKYRKWLQANGNSVIVQDRQRFEIFANPSSSYNVIDPNNSERCWKAYDESILPNMNKTG